MLQPCFELFWIKRFLKMLLTRFRKKRWVFRLFQHGKPTLILSGYSAGLTSLLIINTNHRTFLNCSTNRHNKFITENLLVPLEIF